MSILSPVIDSIDGSTRRIFLKQGVSDFYPIEDIYHEYRHLRKTNESLRKWHPFLRAEGNIPKGAGAYTPRYVVLLEGTKIVPFDESLQINQLGDMITDNPDVDPSLYDISALTVAKPIFIKPSEAETIQLNSESIVFSSFQGAVWVDVFSAYGDKGSAAEPNGNTERPVNNIPLAVEIAQQRGFRVIQVIGNLTLDIGDDVAGFELIGVSHVNSALVVNPGADCLQTRFTSFDMSGTLDGNSEINNCVIGDLAYFNGHIHDCLLNGTITLDGDANAVIDDCAMLNILNPPVINCNYSDQNLVMTNWSGQLHIVNAGIGNNIGVGCDAADLIIHDSCTNGIIAVSGTGSLIDESGPDCYVVNKIIDGSELANLQRVIEHLRPHHTGTGDVWYWDPYGGSDIHHGDAPDRAFKTFAKCHAIAKNANHDTIMIVPGDPSGVTVITEEINITKDYLFLRGPGRDVIIQHDDTPLSIQTSARGTEFSGFRISNSTLNSTAIHSTGAFTLCENLWIENTANGILMNNHHPLIHSCKIHGASGYAIKMEGEISHGEIYDCTAGDAGDTTIQINTTADTGGIKMRDTIIVGSAGYGVSLSPTTRKFISESNNVVKFNTLGNYDDQGTENVTGSVEASGGDVNIIAVGGVSVDTIDDFKADLTLVPQEVWNFASRTLTSTLGLTAAQEAKLDKIIIDIETEAKLIKNTTIAMS
ncbi:MAG: right-handed parallel beta-helix repeat-containing protein [Clostridiales bacterium]|nr:right-handed parallel beta-helix repeat-containing protein [Clostridiales bacterium]